MIANEYRLYLRMILVLLASVSQPPAGDFNVNLCSNESLAEYERTHARPVLVGGSYCPLFPTNFPNFHRRPGLTIEVLDTACGLATQAEETNSHHTAVPPYHPFKVADLLDQVIFAQNRVCSSIACSHTRTR